MRRAFTSRTPSATLMVDGVDNTNEKEVQYNSIDHRQHDVTLCGTTLFAGVNVDF